MSTAPRHAQYAVPLVVLGVTAIVLGWFVHLWLSVDHLHIGRSDFTPTYVAGELWRTDPHGNLYDVQTQSAAYSQVAEDRGGYLPFVSPPLDAVIGAAFTGLPLDAAYRAWSALQAVALLAAAAAAIRAAPFRPTTGILARAAIVAAAVVAVGPFLEVMLGQWDGVLALGIAGAYTAWRGGHPGRAGFWLGLAAAVAKPHLALGLASFLIGRREWRSMGGGAAGVAVVALLTALLTGPAAWVHFPDAVRLEASLRGPTGSIGIYGAVGALFDNGFGTPLTVALTLVALAVAVWAGDRARHDPAGLEPALATAVVISLLAAPHVIVYDLALLSVPAILAFAHLDQSETRPWPAQRGLRLLAGWVAFSAAGALVAGLNPPVQPAYLIPYLLMLIAGAGAVITKRARGSNVLTEQPNSRPP